MFLEIQLLIIRFTGRLCRGMWTITRRGLHICYDAWRLYGYWSHRFWQGCPIWLPQSSTYAPVFHGNNGDRGDVAPAAEVVCRYICLRHLRRTCRWLLCGSTSGFNDNIGWRREHRTGLGISGRHQFYNFYGWTTFGRY